MRFKKWLYNEIIHRSIPTQQINGITTDGIDWRFEDWKLGTPDGKMMPKPTNFIWGSFSAPVDGGYLNVSQEDEPVSSGSIALKTQLSPIEVTKEARFETLPYDWFEFAVLYLRNKVVKPPAYPRDDTEKNIKSVDVQNN